MEVYSDPVDRFGLLCRYLGARSVAENLGVDEEFVARVLAGEEQLEEHHVGELEDLFYLVRDVVGGDAGSGVPVVAVVDGAGSGARRARAVAAAAAAGDPGGGALPEAPEAGAIVVRNVSQVPSELALGVDLDGDGLADVSLSAMVSGRPSVGWKDEQDKRRVSLRNSRALAVMTMFRLGMTYGEQVAALGLVSQIELALISYFKESVPEPGTELGSSPSCPGDRAPVGAASLGGGRAAEGAERDAGYVELADREAAADGQDAVRQDDRARQRDAGGDE